MLLYTHPVNDERVRGGLLPVNSFWASGTGALLPGPPTTATGLQVAYGPRDAALLQDWPAWAAAWQQIDDRQCRQMNLDLERGQPVTLTLCGEANARSWSGAGTGLWRRLRSAIRRPSLDDLFETL